MFREKLLPKCALYSLLRIFIENNWNTISISMDITPNKLPLYMGKSAKNNMYYKYFRYRLSWAIVHSVSLNNQQSAGYYLLLYIYLLLLRSVNSPALVEYGSWWAPVSMVDTFSIDPQNCKRFNLYELLWKLGNENMSFFKLFCMMGYFRYIRWKFL